MKGIAAICLLAALSGCSATQIKPQTTPVAYRTPIDGATGQLVLPIEIQKKVITQKPSFGKAWSLSTFEIQIGEPLSKALVADFQSRVTSARIGDVADSRPASIRLTATDVAVEFGVDDANATSFWKAGVVGLGTDVVPAAKVTLIGSVAVNGGQPQAVQVVGVGATPMAYARLEQSDFTEVIGLAIDDAVAKFGAIAQQKAQASP